MPPEAPSPEKGGSEVEAGYSSGEVSVHSLVAAVPGLRELAELTGEQIAQIGSQDINDGLWLELAARVNALFAADKADGIVITHGTDTAEETGFFLHLTVKSDHPVVLTGSMRPATSLSADGPLNLYNAVAVAADPGARGRGAIVAINNDLHSARDVDLIRASVSLGARGIVMAGMGNGNVSTEAAAALAEAVKAGVVVVRSTRMGSGDVGRNIEMDDDALGTLAADQLSPHKSRVLLQLCIATGMDRGAVQDAFYRY